MPTQEVTLNKSSPLKHSAKPAHPHNPHCSLDTPYTGQHTTTSLGLGWSVLHPIKAAVTQQPPPTCHTVKSGSKVFQAKQLSSIRAWFSFHQAALLRALDSTRLRAWTTTYSIPQGYSRLHTAHLLSWLKHSERCPTPPPRLFASSRPASSPTPSIKNQPSSQRPPPTPERVFFLLAAPSFFP